MSYKSFIITIILSLALFSGAPADEIIIPDKYISARQAPVISDRAMSYLEDNATERKIKIWVYFTDKGVTSDRAFRQKAQEVRSAMTSRALARRAKNGAEAVRFNDLPVYDNYIEQIEGYGLKLRRVSKWLNAASFETSIEKIDLLKNLTFIKKIEPVVTYHRRELPQSNLDPDKFDQQPIKLDGRTLSYGASFPQLVQINAVAAHDSGYSGQGVWVAMFDTGFRKSHSAFANIIAESRLIAEYDFVFDDGETSNEPEDMSSAWNHGTYTWSTLGGGWHDYVYGPAYGASFVLCKTEDVRSETEVEEDNWEAAVEWVDSIGVDVISSSLGYTDWHVASDYDGNTAVVTIAADYAASVGIVVCNSAGNDGSGSATINTPSDADSILSIGAVYASGHIVGFSSRGPTYDGRTKPEVCARGVDVTCAGPAGDNAMAEVDGTSLSCPLVGGATALVIEAHPEWTAAMVREALMETADSADSPNNTYGWGVIDVMAAINYDGFGVTYQKGDADHDLHVNISDAVYIINYVFVGGPEPVPEILAGDANDDEAVDISDASFIINYIFVPGSPAPPGL
jgi:subtilisin family serine protease